MSGGNKYKYLSKINNPDDLKSYGVAELNTICDELRDFIIQSISVNPAHFGASLGVVELTVALHYAYNVPYDSIIWDVGHQAYGHKILTGRRDVFNTNRKYKGISGFPTPVESPYDSFGVGHSSTSISAALGISVANKLQGNTDKKVIAVIGDGSLTGGLAFEGLNNAAATNADMLIILNDNKIAIDKSTGGLREYLTDISTSKTYNRIKDDVWRFLGRVDRLGGNVQGFTQKIDNALKSIILKNSNLFESLGIRYFGPVDGHDVVLLSKLFNDFKDIQGPKVLHVITKKGKGFQQAEMNQTQWHAAPGKFDAKTGKLLVTKDSGGNLIKFQDVFGNTLVDLASKNKDIVGITPAMLTGCSMIKFNEAFPERCFDVGIAEQHAVTFAAGLAIKGLKPFCNIYSSFSQRSYDQIIHDVALQNLPVTLCLDRAGIVGEDGATHQGAFDISFLRCVPNMVIGVPRNAMQLRNMMYTAQLEKSKFPFAIRYPKAYTDNYDISSKYSEIEIGKGSCLKEGTDIAVLCVGPVGNTALSVAEELTKVNYSISVYDMIFAKPIDEGLLTDICNKYKKIITIEDNSVIGGFGSAVSDFISINNINVKHVKMGIPDKFVEHGNQEQLKKMCSYDFDAIKKNIVYICESLIVC